MIKKYRTVYGVDPDTFKHGVAIYQDGELTQLVMLELTDIIDIAQDIKQSDLNDTLFSIEDVSANKFVYGRNTKASKAAQSKVAMDIGRVQQSQVELQRVLEKYDIPYVLHKPSKLNWANNKPVFEKVTGWTGLSNPDKRSAAYFGYLAAKYETKAVKNGW